MASVRAGRDVGGMNDLPIPGQPGSTVPDFDINTMKLARPAAQPAPQAAPPPPAPDPSGMTRFAPAQSIPMLPSVAAGGAQPKVAPTPTPMDQADTDDLTNQRLMKIIAPDPNDPTYNATPVTGGAPKAAGAGGGGSGGGGASPPPPIPMLKPGSDTSAAAAGGDGGGSSIARMRQESADVIRNQVNAGHLNPSIAQKQLEIIKGLPGGENTDISIHPQADTGGFDLKKWAIRLGIPLGVAALLFRGKLGEGMSGLSKMFDLGGGEIAPDVAKAAPQLEDLRPRTYGDDTISPATDEARARVNDASGGQPVTQEGQDKVARQLDINSGKIKPQDYQQGEKPKPGTEGYKAWFKYRQQLSRGNRTAPQ